MRWLRSLIKGWKPSGVAARQEFLYDPDVMLFDRVPAREGAGDR